MIYGLYPVGLTNLREKARCDYTIPMVFLNSKQTPRSGQNLSELRINVISDLHHCSDRTVVPWMPGSAYDAQERLERTLEIARIQNADLTLWLGDIVDRGHVASYSDVDKTVRKAELVGNFFVTPGNHDRRAALRDSIRNDKPTDYCEDGAKVHYVIERGKHLLFILDSAPSVEFSTSGQKVPDLAQVGNVGRDWLHSQLSSIANDSTAWIFTHYPAHQFNVPWINRRAIMQDGVELHNILVAHKARVGGVFSGHLHHIFTRTIDDIDYHSLMPASVPLTVTTPDHGSTIIQDPEGNAGLETLVLRGRKDYEITPQF